MIARQLANPELVHAKAPLEDIFETLDPFDEPFKGTVPARLILYPAHGYELADSTYSALAAAALAFGETAAYYATVEGQGTRELRSVWELTFGPSLLAWFEASASDGSRNPIAESALWSANGTWGLLVSHEQHIVVGGSDEFVARLLDHIPDADEQAMSFIRNVTHYATEPEQRPTWLRGLVTHIYGTSKASGLLSTVDGQPR